MFNLTLVLVCSVPAGIVGTYLYIQGTHTKIPFNRLILLVIASYLVYPASYVLITELYDVFVQWQIKHCQYGYGLANPDKFCINPRPFSPPMLNTKELSFIILLLGVTTQITMFFCLQKFKSNHSETQKSRTLRS